MTELTLHRAGRVVESIRAAIGKIDLNRTSKVSIFGDAVAEHTRKSTELQAAVDKVERLLAIQGRIRTAVGRANAEIGISDLLAEKSAHEEWIKLTTPLASAAEPKSDMPAVMRRYTSSTEIADGTSLDARAKAMRDRFASADANVDSAVEVRLLDDSATTALAKRIAERRRAVEALSDRLRELNMRMIVLNEADLAYLRQEDVI